VVNPFRPRVWLARHSFSNGWLVLTVALAAIAYVVAALCLMALTWDGAGYVFNSIQRGHPAVPNSRFSDYPFLALISLLSFRINDARWLASIYGLALAILPVGALLLSFHFLSSNPASQARQRSRGADRIGLAPAPHSFSDGGSEATPQGCQPQRPRKRGNAPRIERLRIWPVLGVLLSVLPGQAFLVAEAVPMAQVSWAVWAIVAADISGPSLVWLGVLNLFLFFLHPSAALVYIVTGGLFLGKAWVSTHQRRANAWLGVVFLGLAVIRLWYGLATANSYERAELTFSENYLAFRDALPSLRMLPVVYLLGLTVLGAVTGRISRRLMIGLAGLTLALLLAYGIGWAAQPKVWVSAFSFRRFVLVGTLPLVVLGALHWWYEHASPTPDPLVRPDHGLGRIMVGSAGVFSVVFAIQALTWRQELSHFEADLSRCDKPVATVDDLPWIEGTPLHHWASTQLSCVLQAKEVKTVFALRADDVRGNKILLFPGAWFGRKSRWFEFE
jgi:hypothetical protein